MSLAARITKQTMNRFKRLGVQTTIGFGLFGFLSKDKIFRHKILPKRLKNTFSTLFFQINQLEEALSKTREENNQRLNPLNQVILRLEAELRDVRAQLERHMKNNIHLLGVKMQLEDEMNKYHRLMHDITADPER